MQTPESLSNASLSALLHRFYQLFSNMNPLLYAQSLSSGLVFPILIILFWIEYKVYLLIAACHILVAIASLEIMYIQTAIRTRNRSIESPLQVQTVCEEDAVRSTRMLAHCNACWKRWVSAFAVLFVYGSCYYGMVYAEARHTMPYKGKYAIPACMLYTYCLLVFASSVFCGILAPCTTDATVMAMYQACFLTFTYNNLMIRHGIMMINTLDSFFIFLVALGVVITLRITQGRNNLESILAVILDTAGLFCIVMPLTLISDCVVHPNVVHMRYELIHLFISIWFSQIGYELTLLLPISFEKRWGIGMFQFAIVVSAGTVGFIASYYLFGGRECLGKQLMITGLGIGISHIFRECFLRHKRLASILCEYEEFTQRSFVLEWLIPCLVATVSMYPYVKYRILAYDST